MTGNRYGLGNGLSYGFFVWAPDRELNPQYTGLPDIDPAGIVICRGEETLGACWFKSDVAAQINGGHAMWDLISLSPLHIEPSVRMYRYDPRTRKHVPSLHGFIRNGVWVPA